MFEEHLLFLAADIGQSQFGCLHAAQFVARVDDRVVGFVVEQTDILPGAVNEEFQFEVLRHVVDAQIERHALEGDVAVAFNHKFAPSLPVDDFECWRHVYLVSAHRDRQQRQLADSARHLERIVFSHIAERGGILGVVAVNGQ